MQKGCANLFIGGFSDILWREWMAVARVTCVGLAWVDMGWVRMGWIRIVMGWAGFGQVGMGWDGLG